MGNQPGGGLMKYQVEEALLQMRNKYKVSPQIFDQFRLLFEKMHANQADKFRVPLRFIELLFKETLGTYALQLAKVMDRSHDGTVDILEWMLFWCIQFGGSVNEKVETFFKLLDVDDNNLLGRQELLNFIVWQSQVVWNSLGIDSKSQDEWLKELPADVDTLFDNIDIDKKDLLNLQQILAACGSNADFLSFFTQFATDVTGNPKMLRNAFRSNIDFSRETNSPPNSFGATSSTPQKQMLSPKKVA